MEALGYMQVVSLTYLVTPMMPTSTCNGVMAGMPQR